MFRRSEVGQPVGRAPHAAGPTVEDVRVDLGGGHIAVPEELLHGTDVAPIFEEMGGEGVADGWGGSPLGEPRPPDGFDHGTLHHGLVQVMASALAVARST